MKYLLLIVHITFLIKFSLAQPISLRQDSGLGYYIDISDDEHPDTVTQFSIYSDKEYSVDELKAMNDYLGKVYLPDSIYIYWNIQVIWINDWTIEVIYPATIDSLKHLYGLYNGCRLSDESYNKVPCLDSLYNLNLGIITDSITEIPLVCFSPLLEELDILYIGQNDKLVKKMIKFGLKKDSLKELACIQQYEFEFSSSVLKYLKKMENRYKKRGKKLVFFE